jgi:serine/threonine-protein kinase HipA
MPDDAITVDLLGEQLGTLRQTRAGAQWQASEQALEKYGIGSLVLSVALPLDSSPSPVPASEAFFGGLLPEGPRLDALLRDTPGSSRENLVGLLALTGRDAIGGVVLPGPPITALGPALCQEEVELEVANPRGYVAGGGSGIPGMQPKVALARAHGRWHAARDGHPSTHIVKPFGPDSARGAHAQVWLMALARGIGLIDYQVQFEQFGDIGAVVVERFDRVLLPDGGVGRVHQEDAAQALGLPWGGNAKFEWAGEGASLRAIARLLDRHRTITDTGPSDREALLAHTVFRLLAGDTDGHAKNHGLLHSPDGGVTLAPLYDVTSQVLYGGTGEAVAMFIDGRRSLRDIDAGALVREARTWGVQADVAARVIESVALDTLEAARTMPTPDAIAAHLPGYVTRACGALLDGDTLGLALGEFPTLRSLEVQ